MLSGRDAFRWLWDEISGKTQHFHVSWNEWDSVPTSFCLPTTYRPPTDHQPTTNRPPTNRPPTDHLPTTYRPLHDYPGFLLFRVTVTVTPMVEGIKANVFHKGPQMFCDGFSHIPIHIMLLCYHVVNEPTFACE